MANKRTMRKRKKLGMWKQDTWKYYILKDLGDQQFEFLGTAWGWNRAYAIVKANRRYPNTKVRVVYDQLLVGYLIADQIVNEEHPKIVGDRKVMEYVRGIKNDWIEDK